MFIALAYLPAVTVNILWSFSSVAVALVGISWLAEYPTRFQWLGVVLVSLGAVIFFYPAAPPSNQLIGILVAVIGVLANASASILGRDVNRKGEITPLVVTIISMGIGAITLLVTGLVFQGLPTITIQGWGILAWLAIVNTAFAFTLWNHTLRTLSAMESSIINGTMIIWIPLFAIVFLDERITVVELIGLVIVALGTIIVQLRQPSVIFRLLGKTNER
jgi:drug/metabolite transporter (DMT)-like permease